MPGRSSIPRASSLSLLTPEPFLSPFHLSGTISASIPRVSSLFLLSYFFFSLFLSLFVHNLSPSLLSTGVPLMSSEKNKCTMATMHPGPKPFVKHRGEKKEEKIFAFWTAMRSDARGPLLWIRFVPIVFVLCVCVTPLPFLRHGIWTFIIYSWNSKPIMDLLLLGFFFFISKVVC